MERWFPYNIIAAFGKASESGAKKPSALLLHYNYGVAAVKLWGRKTHILEDLAKKSRPLKSVPALFGASKQVHHDNRLTREKALSAAEEAGTSKAAAWDEDDVMLFFWGNSRAATARNLKVCEEKRESLEQWRQCVDSEM